jgi:hypothetical protein
MNTRRVIARAECSHCVSCNTSDSIIQLNKKRIGTDLDLGASYSDAGITEVAITIRSGQQLNVLRHTILFPLTGFLTGATLGMILIEHDLASVVLSGVGLVIGIMATRPLNPDVVCIEPVLDNKHPEMNPK